MSDSSELLVGNARTALKIALKQLGALPGQHILVPDFVCDVVIHSVLQMDLIPLFYPVNQDLVPDWCALESIATSRKCHSLIMINYFGQPQEAERYKSFCLQHNLYLIEDNAHGYGGSHGGKLLGTLGDVGISSPRKLINIPLGGVLHGATPSTLRSVPDMDTSACRPMLILKTLLRVCRPVWRYAQCRMNRSKNWNDPNLYQETMQPDLGIDIFSRWRINAVDWPAIAKKRRKNWSAWAKFARNRGLKIIFQNVHPESCPWAMPVYAKNLEERNSWLVWGAKNRLALFPWPTLPEDVISLGGEALERWKVLICFPLDSTPKELGL